MCVSLREPASVHRRACMRVSVSLGVYVCVRVCEAVSVHGGVGAWVSVSVRVSVSQLVVGARVSGRQAVGW